jgi:hypothetical protein
MAIVHSAGGVRFVATGPCPDALSVRLAGYVRGRCDDVLWADAAQRVRALLDDGKLPEAIALYFKRTGERWDRERLDLVTLENEECWIPDEERMADAGR